MENNKHQNMDWDKVFKQLDGDHQEFENFNQEELETLMLSEVINMKLNEKGAEERFSVEAGWKALFEIHIREEERKVKRLIKRKIYSFVTAAAAVVCILAAGWYFFKSEDYTPSTKMVLTEVTLTLPDGNRVNVEQDTNVLKVQDLALKGNTLIYKKEVELLSSNEQLSTNTSKMNVLEVPYGKYTKVLLSDGSAIWINAGSKLSYPTVFAADKRAVTLDGEAYFEVSHQSDRPFIVHTKDVNVRVLGTSFGISTFGKKTLTALERGKVSMETTKKSLVLKPGELGVFSMESGLAKTMVDTKVYTAWKDHRIFFDNAALQDITDRLSREYDVEFVFENHELKQLHFTIEVDKEASIKGLLEFLRISNNQIDFEQKGEIIYVKNR